MNAADAISARTQQLGYVATLTETTLELAGPHTLELDLSDLKLLARGGRPAAASELLDLRSALPGRGRGDQRELLIAAIVRDAAPDAPTRDYKELSDALGEPGALDVLDEVQRNVLAQVMREHYWVRPQVPGRGAAKEFAFPFHAAIPANFSPRAYKMFRSDILLFLCWDGNDIDRAPVEALCKLLSDRDDLTLPDELLVEAAIEKAGPDAVDSISADDLLMSEQADKVRGFLAAGAYLQEAQNRFREDLVAALEMPLARHDRVEAAILTLSLHLALYYYEISFRLGRGLDDAMAIAASQPLEPPRDFSDAIRFRVATSDARPVRRADPCAVAWRELDDRYLITMTPNIVVANLLHAAWSAIDPGAPVNPDTEALAAAMGAQLDLAETIDATAGALAIVYAEAAGSTEVGLSEVAGTDPGIYALRQVVLEDQRRGLHYRTRAVVNQLVKRTFGGSLIRTRGPIIFFELDESFLYLLVRFVLRRAGEDELPFRQFLEGLQVYGLAPQTAPEEDELANVLEQLGMLHRYSDAGEAIYVRHLL